MRINPTSENGDPSTESDIQTCEFLAHQQLQQGKSMSNEHNLRRHGMSVDKHSRAIRLGQKPVIIWFTGLSGSGKSTTADVLERTLFAMGHSTYLLDGDNVRHGLCLDLGFSATDRVENIRRVSEVSKLMLDAGLIVVASFISPFRAERDLVRNMVGEREFIECYIKTPLEVCERRDAKGLYKKARAGKIKDFTGIDSPYEAPQKAEITIDTEVDSTEELVAKIIGYLQRNQFLPANGDTAKGQRIFGGTSRYP